MQAMLTRTVQVPGATVAAPNVGADIAATAGALAPRAAIFYPSADTPGAGTLCLTEGQPGEAALVASMLPFVIPEKTGPVVGEQPQSGYAFEAASVAAANPYYAWVLYTSPEGDLQIVAMTVQPGDNIRFEVHPDFSQIITVQQGTATVRIGNQLYHVGPGAWIVVPPKTIHEVINRSAAEPLRLITAYTATRHIPGLVEPCKDSAQLAEMAAASVADASPFLQNEGLLGDDSGGSANALPLMDPARATRQAAMGAYFASNASPSGVANRRPAMLASAAPYAAAANYPLGF